jgi:hypothetical protein
VFRGRGAVFGLFWGSLLSFSGFSGLRYDDVCYCSAPAQLLNCFRWGIGSLFGLLPVFGGFFTGVRGDPSW